MSEALLKIHPGDNVAVALDFLEAGSCALGVTAAEPIPRGHKMALTEIPAGRPVIKYGCVIGYARVPIAPGSWVHSHNLRTGLSPKEEYSYTPALPEQKREKAAFRGFLREDGKVGIRNELWIIPTVGCVNGVAEKLARDNQHLVSGTIDGLFAFPHPYGCSQLGDDLTRTAKLLAALAVHPNAGGVLIVGLGCENLTPELFRQALGTQDLSRIRFLQCQDVSDELAEGNRLLAELAQNAAGAKRETVSCDKLVIGLKCGGSDGLSGITANPAVGVVADRITACGGTALLTEVPEMFGAEQLLLDRCSSRHVFDKALAMLQNFKDYFTGYGQPVSENPSPGNREGGITTLEDKSCGCVQKGGTAAITGVLDYAEPAGSGGVQLVWGPGNDLVSATAMTAAGAQIILFTTGRGTPFGAPAPTVKISTNSALYEKKPGWIDFNAGVIAEGCSVESVGNDLFAFMLEIASGKKTAGEQRGERQIAVFKDGVTL